MLIKVILYSHLVNAIQNMGQPRRIGARVHQVRVVLIAMIDVKMELERPVHIIMGVTNGRKREHHQVGAGLSFRGRPLSFVRTPNIPRRRVEVLAITL